MLDCAGNAFHRVFGGFHRGFEATLAQRCGRDGADAGELRFQEIVAKHVRERTCDRGTGDCYPMNFPGC